MLDLIFVLDSPLEAPTISAPTIWLYTLTPGVSS